MKLGAKAFPVASLKQRLCAIVSLDVRSLAVLRMGLGLLTLADLATRAVDLRAHYTDFGVLPRGPLLGQLLSPLCVCLHAVCGTSGGMAVIFLLHALVAVGLCVGYRTRSCCVLGWFLLYSLHLRNPLVLQGGDDLLRMLLFWGMFLPLGATYSADAALQRLHREVLGAQPPVSPPPTGVCNVASFACLVQMLLLYASAALLKTGQAWHSEGSAVYYALHFDQLALPPALWLRSHYQLTVWLTHLTAFWETYGSLTLVSPLFFGPLRTFGLLAFIGMHQGFGVCLMLGLFPWVDAVSMLMLLPTWFWRKAQALRPAACSAAQQRKLTVYYDAGCRSCRSLCYLLQEALWVHGVTLAPSGTDAQVDAAMLRDCSWQLRDARGAQPQLLGGWQVFVALCSVSPLLWPVAPVLRSAACSRVGGWLYHTVSHRRPLWARYVPLGAPPRPPGSKFWALSLQGLVASLLALVSWWNIAAWPSSPLQFPAALRPTMVALRLDQDWGMFAPYPQREDGWFVVQGTLVDGRPVDVLHNRLSLADLRKPALVSREMGNQRWSKYYMNLWLARLSPYRAYYAAYLCSRYNAVRPAQSSERLQELELGFMREWTLPDYAPSTPEKVVLWRHRCD
jgi:hypothetical protein